MNETTQITTQEEQQPCHKCGEGMGSPNIIRLGWKLYNCPNCDTRTKERLNDTTTTEQLDTTISPPCDYCDQPAWFHSGINDRTVWYCRDHAVQASTDLLGLT